MTREYARVHAAGLAASSLAAGKQIPFRTLPPPQLPQAYRTSTFRDLPRLLDPAQETPHGRVTRLSSAALLYSVDKSTSSHAATVLRGRECDVLAELHQARAACLQTDRSCPHCRLLYGTLYDRSRYEKVPPIAVINHSARVDVTFDPETNVSTAAIRNFQVLVPEQIARSMIRLSHPLHWPEPAGSLFQRTFPVDRGGQQLTNLGSGSREIEEQWNRLAREEAFVFEDVVWPINEDISASVQNVLAIRNLSHSNDRTHRSLSYDYALRTCLRSNFGIVWERSGLDIDGGRYDGRAVSLSALNQKTVTFDKASSDTTSIPLGDIQPRDVQMMRSHEDPSLSTRLYQNELDPLDSVDVLETIKQLGSRLQSDWNLGEYYLLNVSASKIIHFTIPENGPIELWHLLTLTAPAFLFTFLNQAICLGPHVLMDSMLHSAAGGTTNAAG